MTPSEPKMSAEWWKPSLFGYCVSNMGRISGKRKDALKPIVNIHGYARVCMYSGDGKKYKSVHSLVAEAFIGPRQSGATINHVDGNKLNNEASNLEYLTLQENLKHGWRMGRKCAGDTHGRRKLNSTEVGEIKQLWTQGCLRKNLAKSYGVSESAVSRVVNNRSWLKSSEESKS